jgi:polyisoprenoid-binding protein YceI
MNIRKFSALAVVALSMVCAGAQAQMSTWTIDPAHSSIQFTIRHLGVSNVHGTISGVKGTVMYDDKNVSKSVTLDLDGPAPPMTQRGKTISGFSATGSIKRADFNFGAKFAPPMLGDDVKIEIDVEIDKQ